MKAFCEMASKVIIPAVRALIALMLIEKFSMTQVEIARRLGITQPAISYYMHSRRGKLAISILKNDPEVMKLIEKAADMIYEEKVDDEILCDICRTIRRNKKLINDICSLLSK